MRDVKRALISVSDKNGVVDFARELTQLGFEIVSTGGTAKLLSEKEIEVTTVADLTGFPEILDGRVKSLHPKIHAGLLAKRNEKHMDEMRQHYIEPIDIAAINLYPFEETISKKHTFDEAIEHIDIGGPTMIRSAAKNHEYITVIVDPNDYPKIIEELKEKKQTSKELKFDLARKAFSHTARYDALIAEYLNTKAGIAFPDLLNLTYKKKQETRYGENPHQKAAFYMSKNQGIGSAEQLNGKELSFNNILDANTALEIVQEFSEPTCVIVKHNNPCGVACGKNVLDAYKQALATDPLSSFGGIVALNQPVSEKLVEEMSSMFFEIVIAPSFDESALEKLKEKKNLRILRVSLKKEKKIEFDIKKVDSGILYQEKDQRIITAKDLQTVTKRKPTDKEIEDSLFAWKVVKHVKSNGIVFAKNKQTLGIGAGQMSRIDSTQIATQKAGTAKLPLTECVMASDAFFPFRDNVEHAANVGVTAIIQPGGSRRDQESIDAADLGNIAMVFTGIRAFRH